MTLLTVVGGIYQERCIQPLWNAVYGSAGRAAQCVASLVSQPTKLHGYVASAISNEAAHLAADCGAELLASPAEYSVSFDYLHPLSTPIIRPAPEHMIKHVPIQVSGDVVLRYGMLEGDAIVNGRTVIYDPQSAFGAQLYSANGSKAERLAVVTNRMEAHAMTGQADPRAAAMALLASGGTEVVIVKMGSSGALVATRDGFDMIPIYRTERVWKLGSGDVFSATFAALWGGKGMTASAAADFASRATAVYCDTRALPAPSVDELAAMTNPAVRQGRGTIYLAGPFFDIAQRWLVEEARRLLIDLGASVFSPVHEVGPGPANVVAPEDIKGLEASDVVFAILNGQDSGTIFEIGYAVKKGIPVVVLAQNLKDEDLKMIAGTGCEVIDDFASALYRAVWMLPPS